MLARALIILQIVSLLTAQAGWSQTVARAQQVTPQVTVEASANVDLSEAAAAIDGYRCRIDEVIRHSSTRKQLSRREIKALKLKPFVSPASVFVAADPRASKPLETGGNDSSAFVQSLLFERRDAEKSHAMVTVELDPLAQIESDASSTTINLSIKGWMSSKTGNKPTLLLSAGKPLRPAYVRSMGYDSAWARLDEQDFRRKGQALVSDHYLRCWYAQSFFDKYDGPKSSTSATEIRVEPETTADRDARRKLILDAQSKRTTPSSCQLVADLYRNVSQRLQTSDGPVVRFLDPAIDLTKDRTSCRQLNRSDSFPCMATWVCQDNRTILDLEFARPGATQVERQVLEFDDDRMRDLVDVSVAKQPKLAPVFKKLGHGGARRAKKPQQPQAIKRWSPTVSTNSSMIRANQYCCKLSSHRKPSRDELWEILADPKDPSKKLARGPFTAITTVREASQSCFKTIQGELRRRAQSTLTSLAAGDGNTSDMVTNLDDVLGKSGLMDGISRILFGNGPDGPGSWFPRDYAGAQMARAVIYDPSISSKPMTLPQTIEADEVTPWTPALGMDWPATGKNPSNEEVSAERKVNLAPGDCLPYVVPEKTWGKIERAVALASGWLPKGMYFAWGADDAADELNDWNAKLDVATVGFFGTSESFWGVGVAVPKWKWAACASNADYECLQRLSEEQGKRVADILNASGFYRTVVTGVAVLAVSAGIAVTAVGSVVAAPETGGASLAGGGAAVGAETVVLNGLIVAGSAAAVNGFMRMSDRINHGVSWSDAAVETAITSSVIFMSTFLATPLAAWLSPAAGELSVTGEAVAGESLAAPISGLAGGARGWLTAKFGERVLAATDWLGKALSSSTARTTVSGVATLESSEAVSGLSSTLARYIAEEKFAQVSQTLVWRALPSVTQRALTQLAANPLPQALVIRAGAVAGTLVETAVGFSIEELYFAAGKTLAYEASLALKGRALQKEITRRQNVERHDTWDRKNPLGTPIPSIDGGIPWGFLAVDGGLEGVMAMPGWYEAFERSVRQTPDGAALPNTRIRALWMLLMPALTTAVSKELSHLADGQKAPSAALPDPQQAPQSR